MNIGSISGLKNTMLDLIAARPAKPEPRPELARPEATPDASSRGFGEVLRERPKPAPASSADTVASRREEQDNVSSVDDANLGDASTEDSSVKDASSATDDRSAEQGKGDEQSGAQASADEDAEAGDLAQSEQDALADKAQADSGQAQAVQFAFGQTPSSVMAPQTKAEAEAYAKSPEAQQIYAALAKAHNDAAARQSAKDGSVPIFNAFAFSTATTDQSGSADSSGGETSGESKASTQILTNSAVATNNPGGATAFAVPEQSSESARLTLNPNPAGSQVDAAKQVQAQPLAANSDSDSLNTSRITRGLANAVQQRGGAVTLRLTPPEMGTVRIQMQITGASVSASFHAESSSAQTLLTNQLAQLRTSLESQGMSVERLTVQPLATSSTSNTNQSQNGNADQQQGQAQNDQANEGRSRGQHGGDRSGSGSGGQDDSLSQQQNARRGFFDRLQDAADPTA